MVHGLPLDDERHPNEANSSETTVESSNHQQHDATVKLKLKIENLLNALGVQTPPQRVFLLGHGSISQNFMGVVQKFSPTVYVVNLFGKAY